MKRLVNVAVALAILLALVAYMVTYTVRFNEAAVVTRFGRAGEGSVVNAPGSEGEPGTEAGLHFKWPYPIEQVARTYDTRTQILQGKLEQQLTRDNQSVMAVVYLTWRITDPLAFYRNVGTESQAEYFLGLRVRDGTSLLGDYRFDQLVNPDPDELRLAELEDRLRDRVQSHFNDLNYGIEVGQVGIKRIVLPASVIDTVFSRMAAERSALANEAQTEGAAEQARLQASARSDADTILSFAESRAADIRARGSTQATAIFASFAQDQDFAIFLQQLDALEAILRENVRFILDTSLPPFSLLRGLAADSLQAAPPASGPTTQPAGAGEEASGGTRNAPPIVD